MKRLKLVLSGLFVLLVSYNNVSAEENDSETIYVNAAKFSGSLVERWITEYHKMNPHVKIRQAEKGKKEVDLEFVTAAQAETVSGKQVTYVGRVALLPVTTKENPVLSHITRKKLGKKDLKTLFFIDEYEEQKNAKKSKPEDQLTVYSGNSAYSGTFAVASHFGYTITDLRGKKISGDDLFLLHALSKDETGIAFNQLNYLYDVETRRLKEELVLLPLDVKKDQLEALNSGDMDEALEVLEQQGSDLIPVQQIGFAYSTTQNEEVARFLTWVLTEGQRFNHQYGFLNLDEKTLSRQQNETRKQFLSSTNTKY
ncbi:MAG: hypothetical protein LUH10_18010 [Tannerellaceae bacterium]|nr:hypothetical protein [Tannerellaceae bacterium]